jgi:hypothetical protein
MIEGMSEIRNCLWCASGRTQCPKHEPLAELLRREAPFKAGQIVPGRMMHLKAEDYNALAEELRSPNLGRATTRELLEELQTRYRIGASPSEMAMASKLQAISEASSAEQLAAYRTADNG